MATMRCPICGAKMRNGFCEYCKIREEQVTSASNKQAKKAFKTGVDKDQVVYSSTIPADVNKVTLILLTVLLGYTGVPYFYVGKYARAWTMSVVWVVTIVFESLRTRVMSETLATNPWIYYMSKLLLLLCAGFLLLWVSDVINLIFHRYSVPVILGENKSKFKRK